MIINSLILNNFGPFKGNQSVDLTKLSSVIFIKGQYQENPKESNQSGKSSFLDSIVYLLFGEIRKDIKETDLIHKGESQMYVEGNINVNGIDIRIKRGRTSSNSAILEIEGKNFVGTNTQKNQELITQLGMTYKDFICSNFFKQGDIFQFTSATPGDRKKLLQRWFNLDRWLTYENKAKAKEKEAYEAYTKLETKRGVLNSQLVTIVIPDADYSLKKSEDDLAASYYRSQLLEAELAQLPDFSELKKKFDSLTQESETIFAQMFKYSNEICGLNSKILESENTKRKLVDIQAKLHTPAATYIDKISTLRINLERLAGVRNEKTKTLHESNNLLNKICAFSSVCPVDNQLCDKGSRIPDQKDSLLKDIEVLKKYLAEDIENVQAIKAELQLLSLTCAQTSALEAEATYLQSTCGSYQGYVDSISVLNNSLILLNKNYLAIKSQLSDLQNELSKLDLSKKDELNQLITNEESLRTTLTQEIHEIQAKIAYQNAQKQRKANLETEIATLGEEIKISNKNYLRWKYCVGLLGKDIPNILIENSLSEIEEFGNVILDSISRGKMSFEFTTSKELASSKESHCSVCGANYGKANKCESCGYGIKKNKIKDELDLKITNQGIDLPFSLVSDGMGKYAVSIALRLGLSKLLNSNKATSCDILILDEVFGALDEVNRKEVSGLLFNQIRLLLGIQQVFIVSHCDMNDFPYDSIKIIRNTSGFSQITLDKQ